MKLYMLISLSLFVGTCSTMDLQHEKEKQRDLSGFKNPYDTTNFGHDDLNELYNSQSSDSTPQPQKKIIKDPTQPVIPKSESQNTDTWCAIQ